MWCGLVISLTASVFVSIGTAMQGRNAEAVAELATALRTAAQNGDSHQVKALLAMGADPNARDRAGDTPLTLLSAWSTYDVYAGGREERYAEVARQLAAHGGKLNAQNGAGMTPLAVAAASGHAFIARALINLGADPWITDKRGRSPLTWAAERGKDDTLVVKPLMEHGAQLGLVEALLFGDTAAARRLAPTADLWPVGPSGETALELAALEGDAPTMKALLKRGVDVNAQDDSGVTALIVSVGARPILGQVGRIWQRSGGKKDRAQIVSMLLNAGARVNARTRRGETGLLGASELEEEGVVRQLLNRGANPNVIDEFGYTPLNTAIRKGNRGIVRLLLRSHANMNLADSFYTVPLVAAVGSRTPDEEIIRLLLDRGAKVSDSRFGRTPLMEAAHEGTAQSVRLLLKRGADINATGDDGFTALMLAAGWNSPDIVALLIAHGADIRVKNNRGQTALELAKEKGRSENVTLLERVGANN